MNRFKNILVVYANAVGDDDALMQATELARRNAAQLTLIEVVDERDMSAALRVEREKRLARIAASIENEGLPVAAVLREGTPFIEITKEVMRAAHDLVILTAEQPGGFRSLFFGNTSMRLQRKCPCPVWVVKPGQQNQYNRILAAIDPDAAGTDFVDRALDLKILDLATSLARATGAELHLLHAWELSRADLDVLRCETPPRRERLLHKHLGAQQRKMEQLLAPYDLQTLPHHIHLPRGEAAEQLPAAAAEHGADLLVMGTVQRTGVGGLLIGSTAEIVLRQVECGVLTVKPEGFVSPVLPDRNKDLVASKPRHAAELI